MTRIMEARKLSRLLSFLGLFSALACSSLSVRGRDRGPEGGSGQRPGADTDWPRASSPRFETRQQCRAASRPTGWIAVSYLQLGDQCQKVGDDPFIGVQLRKFGDRPVGSVLDTCTDQVITRGWSRISAPSATDCEGAHVKQDQPTAVRIQKSESTP